MKVNAALYQYVRWGRNRELEGETMVRWQRDRDRLTICVLVVISWEAERQAKRKSNTKVRV